MISIWQIKQDISDLEGHKIAFNDEGKDAAERVIDDLERLLDEFIKWNQTKIKFY